MDITALLCCYRIYSPYKSEVQREGSSYFAPNCLQYYWLSEKMGKIYKINNLSTISYLC